MKGIEGATPSVRNENNISQFEGKGIRETHEMIELSWKEGGKDRFMEDLSEVTSFEDLKNFFLNDKEAGIAGRTMRDISEGGPDERRFYAFNETPETIGRDGYVEHERQIMLSPMPTIFMSIRDAADSVFRSDLQGNYTKNPYQSFIDRVSGKHDGGEVYEGVEAWIMTFLESEGITADMDTREQKDKLKSLAQKCRDVIGAP